MVVLLLTFQALEWNACTIEENTIEEKVLFFKRLVQYKDGLN